MTMSLVCTSTNTISKQEHMATPSLNDQPFIDTTRHFKKIMIRKKTRTRYESIFRRGYSVFCQFCQKIELFLGWMMANLGKPIRYAPT